MSNYVDAIKGLENVKPIVICGAARSGTRMLTDILNSHSNIVIQEEMHAKTIEKYFEFIDAIGSNFEYYSERKGKNLSVHWNDSLKYLNFSFFASANKRGLTGFGKDIIFSGIKTPGYERYFASFDKIFPDSPPVYMYCIRDVAKVWRSWKTIGFLDDVMLFRTRYERSLRQALKIKKSAPDRFFLFDLDSYVEAADKKAFVESNIFGFLGVAQSDYIDSALFENRNSIKNYGAEYIEREELAKDIDILLGCDRIKSLRTALLE